MAHNRKRSNSTPPKPSALASTISFPPVPSRLSLDHDDPGRPSPSSSVNVNVDDPHTDNDKVQPKVRKGFRRKVTTKVGELVKAGLSTPPHASHMVAGPSFIYAPDSTPLLSFAEIQRHHLAMSSGRHHDIQGIPLPAPFFDPDIYYFAPRSNVGKRPSTAAAAESSTSLANSTASSTLTRATSVGNKSSITRRRDRHANQASSGAPPTPSSPPFSPSSKPSTSTPSTRKRPSAGTGSTSAIPATALPVSSEDLPSHSFEFELVDIDPSSSLPTTVNLSLTNNPAGPSYSVPPARAPELSQDPVGLEGAPSEKLTRGRKSSTTHMQKGAPSTEPFDIRNGKRHHTYSPSRAPYPRSYDSAAIDHDISTHLFFQSLSRSLTWHEFESPPRNILDLGCGNGVWVLDAAQAWPESHFVGLDLVPLQPKLSLVAPKLHDRIQWVNSNFLEKLPFPDSHFDFVHIRRIARGVPEDKWPFLLEEVSRVLKPDGAIEVVEEDLIFPGGQEPCTCHYPPEMDIHWYSDDGHDKPDSIDHSSSHGSNTHINGTTVAAAVAASRSRSGTSGTGDLVPNLSQGKTDTSHGENTPEKEDPGRPSRAAEASNPVSSPRNPSRAITTDGSKSPHSRNIPLTNRSMPHLLGDDGEFGQLPASHPSQPPQSDPPHRSATLTARQLFTDVNWQNSLPSYDHSRLEQAYNDMHSSRFINLMPISVLTSQLNHYFKEIQSHPPVLITFPPPEDEMWSEEEGSGTESGSVSVSGGLSAASHFSPNFKLGMTPIAPNASAETVELTKQTKPRSNSTTQSSVVGSTGSSRVESSVDDPTSPSRTQSSAQSQPHATDGGLFNLSSAEDDHSQYLMRPPVGGWHTLHLDARSLVNPKQPFIMIDRCRMPARTGPHQTMSRLPNQTFEMDLQSLTMHLSQSVTEVLECKESIWDWMVENKRAKVKKHGIVPAGTSTPSGGVGGGLALGPSGTLKRPGADAPIDREEFDQWIRRYEKDMKARIGMAEAMRTRLNWNAKGLSSSDEQPNRKMSLVPVGSIPGQEQSPLSVGLGIKSPGSTQQHHVRPRLNSTAHHSSSDVINDPNHHTQFDGFASSTSLVGDDGVPTSGGETGALSDAAAMAIRQRTGSAPEHAIANAAHHVAKPSSGSRHTHKTSRSGGGGHHSRAHSLDGANAWEILMNDNQDMDRKPGLDDVPRLSRCIRVFVAWNSKEETPAPEAAKKA
ncbi:hypothetical protein CPB86DRAFT_870203 [Serendipita vermifera]|nr:hypothetical protein CPB86DRAFT_870203 [Serendipita vermifera]